MHYLIDEDAMETVIHSRPCTACGGALRLCRGVGCNGSFGISSRPRDPAEIREIKAKRQRDHEEAVLAEASAILARRKWIA